MKEKIIDEHGGQLSYAEYGDRQGFPILVQHGLIASIDEYDLFERLVRAKARIICIARPGYGESTPRLMNSYAEWAEIVVALVRNLGLTRFDILGMSSGAPYGYALGNGFPRQVRNIYIFSGMPALYDEDVLSAWPYGMTKNGKIEDMEKLAHELFFSKLTTDDLKNQNVRDSMNNKGFGVAQDLRLRGMAWGFCLGDVKAPVFMRHSKRDDAVPFKTAVRTAELLPNCEMELLESGPHFSNEALDDFIRDVIVRHLEAG